MTHHIHLLADPGPIIAEFSGVTVVIGHPQPLGVSRCGPATNFSLPARRASQVCLVLSDADSGTDRMLIELDPRWHRTGEVWHLAVTGLREPVCYSWRVRGVTDVPPAPGQLELPGRNLLDPWAKAARLPDTPGESWRGLFPVRPYTWQHKDRPRHPLHETVIYELHTRGFTRHPSSGVSHPGSWLGLIEKIPYLKDLGVTAIELLPVADFDHRDNPRFNPLTGEALSNYWGYDPLAFFAPKASYSSTGDPLDSVDEFRQLADALHGAGIELFLDVVFNHSGERNDPEHVIHFRGMDNRLWYMVDAAGHDLDFSGCGNSLNCNHPLVRQYVLECLRWWVCEMGVDGFRFDLASILGRDSSGRVLENPPVLEAIALDPVLADTKLIAEAWDARGLYQVGSFPNWGRWAEWNGQFRDSLRRLLRGEEGQIGAVASRITGSADLYGPSGRSPMHSINFITAHDGFTLADLVRYEKKHNTANGEDNRDGNNHEHSCNWGVEGPSDDPVIEGLRLRQQRNGLALLLLSQGVPMLLAGDEFGRSQGGNNNAWCQDNDISWVDWNLLKDNADLFAYTRSLLELRRMHPMLRRQQFFATGPDSEIQWHGVTPGAPDFGPRSHTLACQLNGRRMAERLHLKGNAVDLYLALNFWSKALEFELPPAPDTTGWRVLLDTNDGLPACPDPRKGRALKTAGRILIESRSLVLLGA